MGKCHQSNDKPVIVKAVQFHKVFTIMYREYNVSLHLEKSIMKCLFVVYRVHKLCTEALIKYYASKREVSNVTIQVRAQSNLGSFEQDKTNSVVYC